MFLKIFGIILGVEVFGYWISGHDFVRGPALGGVMLVMAMIAGIVSFIAWCMHGEGSED